MSLAPRSNVTLPARQHPLLGVTSVGRSNGRRSKHEKHDPLFSITSALFSIHNSAYPHYFLPPTHSLPKTPAGGYPPSSQIATPPLTPIKSKRSTKIAPNSNGMKTFYDTPGVGVAPHNSPTPFACYNEHSA